MACFASRFCQVIVAVCVGTTSAASGDCRDTVSMLQRLNDQVNEDRAHETLNSKSSRLQFRGADGCTLLPGICDDKTPAATPSPTPAPPPPIKGYVFHEGYNCYDGKGGPSVPNAPVYSGKSPLECAELCTKNKGCRAFTVQSRAAASLCWLRASIDLPQCVPPESGYDTYAQSAQRVTSLVAEDDLALKDAYSKVDGQFYCYTNSEGSFLAYDPPMPNISNVVNRQLPSTIAELQTDWMASSFEFGQPCQGCSGFVVETPGIAVVNDAGNEYGGGSDAHPPSCGGCEEEVLVCLSSARSVRSDCSQKPVTPDDANKTRQSESANSCNLVGYKHPWILRNRNTYALGSSNMVKPGTDNYYYMMVVQGFGCDTHRDTNLIVNLIKSFAQGFQGMIDIWRIQPACDGQCEIMSGAVSAWMTYSIPVVLSILAQLRAWASLKIDGLAGCTGNQAVLKFGSVSVTDDGVVCCPAPYAGGRCNQNYKLPIGWSQKLTEGTDVDFANWLVDELGTAGSCYRCGWPGSDAPMCPDAAFSYDSAQCVPKDFKNYIPKTQ